ncbi:hypothetical protein BHM03_00040986 [Ensete ventricosum]|nr:hypothetical protein BHM03_00040986 [Ensete ventricosum]
MYQAVTNQYHAIPVDFDHYRPVLGGTDRFRPYRLKPRRRRRGLLFSSSPQARKEKTATKKSPPREVLFIHSVVPRFSNRRCLPLSGRSQADTSR